MSGRIDPSLVLSALVAGVAVLALAVVAVRQSARPELVCRCEVRP